MKLRVMAMMALVVSVTGCTTSDEAEIYTNSVKPEAPTLIADVSPDFAAAYLPQVAGRVKAVHQSSRPNRISQTVVYPTPGYSGGENRLTISIAPPSSDTSYFQAPTQRQLVFEMRKELPGIAMQISSTPAQNLHGPFGYAIGKASGGETCIFAWQTAKEISRTPADGIGQLKRTHYAAKVRLRYCHPSMGEASLVSLMSGLRIREVTPTTIEMLRFAEGTGVTTRPGYAEERPVSIERKPVHLTPDPAARPKPVPVKTPAKTTTTPAVTVPVSNAPRVLKPGELAGYKDAQEKRAASEIAVVDTPAKKLKPAAKAPSIPLPGDLSE